MLNGITLANGGQTRAFVQELNAIFHTAQFHLHRSTVDHTLKWERAIDRVNISQHVSTDFFNIVWFAEQIAQQASEEIENHRSDRRNDLGIPCEERNGGQPHSSV